MTPDPGFVELTFREYEVAEMHSRAADAYADLDRRRTVRQFADRSVPIEIIENCIRAAGTWGSRRPSKNGCARRSPRRRDVLQA